MAVRHLAFILFWLAAVVTAGATGRPELDALWDYDRPDQSELRFRDLLAKAARADDTAYYAEVQTQLARALGLQQRFDAALAVLEDVRPFLPAAGPRVSVRYLLERGRVLRSSGDPTAASPLFEEAWTLARAEGLDALAVDAAHMVAMVAPREAQLSWNHRALDLAEASGEPQARRWRGSLRNNIGWTLFALGQFDLALVQFEAALALRRSEGKALSIRIARWCVAKTLRQLNRTAEALAIQRELQREVEDSDLEPDGFVLEELAECLLALGRGTAARPYFRQAYRYLGRDPRLSRDEPERLERLRRLGEADP